MKISICIGTRPNFIKAAPLIKAFSENNIPFNTVFTGQHFEQTMSKIFALELDIPISDAITNVLPDDSLGQMIAILEAIRSLFLINKPSLVVIFGDVLSSLACAIAAKTMNIPIAHIEAGERSFDRTMPEETNRIIIDQISDYHFCTSPAKVINLIEECIPTDNTYHVGNIMVDSLLYYLPKIKKKAAHYQYKNGYAVLTLHRQANVDNKDRLLYVLDNIISSVSEKLPIVFPIHPRTRKMLEQFGLMEKLNDPFYCKNLITIKPLGYFEFLSLVHNSQFVMTDSGGLQCETTILNKPCLTLRENTEWPETVSRGTNFVVGLNKELILSSVDQILTKRWGYYNSGAIDKWDGKTSNRIVEILVKNV